MSYTPFTTKAQLLAYIKRQLGDPSHDIELTDEQYDDAINDAVQIFIEKGFDGCDQFYEQLQITTGTQTYTLDSDIMAVLNILQADFTQVNKIAMQQWYNNLYADISNNSSEIILNYAMTQSYLNSVQDLVQKEVMYGFNSITKQLTLYETVNQNVKLLLHTVRHLGGLNPTEENPSRFDYIYGNRYVKAKAEANAWVLWGKQLIKHDAPIWDGNIQINVERIIEMGDKLTEKVDEMLKAEFQDSFGLYAF